MTEGRRAAMVGLVAVLLLGVGPSFAGQAGSEQEWVIFLVRHAEKLDESADPPLDEAGRARAEALAALLADAGIAHILSSDYLRTLDTAAPLAERLGLETALYDPRDLPGLAARILEKPGRYLVVGHSNTTPKLAELLGGDSKGPITDEEYDRLYILTRRNAKTTTTLLRYPGAVSGTM